MTFLLLVFSPCSINDSHIVSVFDECNCSSHPALMRRPFTRRLQQDWFLSGGVSCRLLQPGSIRSGQEHWFISLISKQGWWLSGRKNTFCLSHLKVNELQCCCFFWYTAQASHKEENTKKVRVVHSHNLTSLSSHFFLGYVFNELLTLMIPNICWPRTVHDGIKPIRQYHPWAGVCLALEHVWSSSAEGFFFFFLSASRLSRRIVSSLFVCALVCASLLYRQGCLQKSRTVDELKTYRAPAVFDCRSAAPGGLHLHF